MSEAERMSEKRIKRSVVRDPFRISGPASISFSGGRTSGYLLWRILQSHGGTLPPDVVVTFANTGKEMEETLIFVDACSRRWNVPVVWLEWIDAEKPADRWRTVTFETASRDGEPFAALIKRRNYLPNPVTRICTSDLKVKTMHRYLHQRLGWEEWTSVLGLRADEPRRVAKLNKNHDRYECVAPLARAGITAKDVGDFWSAQDFDLGLPNHNGISRHGNCDLCYLKGSNQIISLIRENPKRALWWMAQESRLLGIAKPDNAVFRTDRPSYAAMYRMATTQGEMFPYDEPLDDCNCTD